MVPCPMAFRDPEQKAPSLDSLSSPRSSDVPQRPCQNCFAQSSPSPVLRTASLRTTVESLAWSQTWKSWRWMTGSSEPLQTVCIVGCVGLQGPFLRGGQVPPSGCRSGWEGILQGSCHLLMGKEILGDFFTVVRLETPGNSNHQGPGGIRKVTFPGDLFRRCF